MDEISRLQNNLPLLRSSANWSVSEFADLLGVTRQTVNNLEKKDPIKMSKIQYLAIRSLFSYEVEKGNTILGQLLYCLVDHPEELTENDANLIRKQASLLSNAVKGGSTSKEIEDTWKQIISLAGISILPIAIEAGIAWIGRIVKDK